MFFLLPVLGSVAAGVVATLAGASLTSIITWSVIGGVLVAAIDGLITRDDIKNAAKEKGIRGAFKIMVNNARNRISLKELNTMDTVMEMHGDSISSDIDNGDLIVI